VGDNFSSFDEKKRKVILSIHLFLFIININPKRRWVNWDLQIHAHLAALHIHYMWIYRLHLNNRNSLKQNNAKGREKKYKWKINFKFIFLNCILYSVYYTARTCWKNSCVDCYVNIIHARFMRMYKVYCNIELHCWVLKSY
jgi:uncharacterized membrane protein